MAKQKEEKKKATQAARRASLDLKEKKAAKKGGDISKEELKAAKQEAKANDKDLFKKKGNKVDQVIQTLCCYGVPDGWWWFKMWMWFLIPDLKKTWSERRRWGKNNTIEALMLAHGLGMVIVGTLGNALGQVVTSILIAFAWISVVLGVVTSYKRLMGDISSTIEASVGQVIEDMAKESGEESGSKTKDIVEQVLAGLKGEKKNLQDMADAGKEAVGGVGLKFKAMAIKVLCGCCKVSKVFATNYCCSTQTPFGILAMSFMCALMFGPVVLVLVILTSSGNSSSSDYYSPSSSGDVYYPS